MLTDRTAAEARRTARRRHPLLWLVRRVRRRRGLSTVVQPPTSEQEILERVAELPLSVWTYGFDDASVRHLGPMSQDFAAAFGLGSSDRSIDVVDANGVALAAIKALYQRVVTLEREVAELRRPGRGASETGR
ncbi:hypothetical protein [Geodermatophilus sp. SYSU D01105]